MKLLVGLDKRDGGKDALELARVLAREEGDSTVAATILFGGPLAVDHALLDESESHEAEPLFEAAREKLAGIELETRAYGGASPAHVLTTLAEAEDFDAIVVGSPHRGPIGRVMIGSVADSLLNGAPTDVAVAPRGYAEGEHSMSPRVIAVGYDGTPNQRLPCAKPRRSRSAPGPRSSSSPLSSPRSPRPRWCPASTPPKCLPIPTG